LAKGFYIHFMEKLNFSPGPAYMPPSVWQELSHSLINYNNSGLSIAEISHRAPAFEQVIEEATALVKEIYQTQDDFEVLWLPGGASAQLAIAPLNLVNADESIATFDTGFWANRAIEAAQQICQVEILASSKATGFDHIPFLKNNQYNFSKNTKYFYVVSNETINGIQYHEYPEVSVPLVADMTSDFLSRPIPLDRFGLIFASAQKNFGMAGITCVLLRKDLMNRTVTRVIPRIFDYQTHIEHRSMYHTCPTVPIYTSLLMLRWLKAQGGLIEMARRNQSKAQQLYAEVDRNPLFVGMAKPAHRSLMNVCFRGVSAEIETEFLTFAEQQGAVGLKGYPSVGGLRASIYNAMPLDHVQKLIAILQNFTQHVEHSQTALV
jgi:phosphoserine aminotransferase